jgi:hypothetical protein
MELDDFSKEFLNRLFRTFPEFKQHSTIKEYENHDRTYLFVEIPSPSENKVTLWISTHEGEVTVGFDWYHSHFSYSGSDEEDYIEAEAFMKDILNERLVAVAIIANSVLKYSNTCNPDEVPVLKDYETLRVRSWKGTYSN